MIFHDVEQNTDAWLALRIGKVTSSHAATFMAKPDEKFGEPAMRYAFQLALERVTGRRIEQGYSNEHMERGHEQEPLARMLYEEMFFADVTNGGFFDWGDYGDSPDGLVDGCGVIEIKSVIPWTHRKTIKRGSYDPAYKWQMVSHLDCTGADWCDFVSFCADYPEDSRLVVCRMHRDEVSKEIEQLRRRRADFLEVVNSELKELTMRRAA